MTKLERTRDVVVLVRDADLPVMLDASMVQTGWVGGQGVEWTGSAAPTVRISDGLWGGLMLWGSSESSDQWVGLTESQPQYQAGTILIGGWVVSVKWYERYTYVSRMSGGDLVPLIYNENDRVRLSRRGLITIEDEWDLSGDPRGQNDWYMGVVVQAPNSRNDQYLTLETWM